MDETEAKKFIKDQTRRSLVLIVMPFFTILGLANVAGFIALWNSVQSAASKAAEREAAKAATLALSSQQSLLLDVSRRAGEQSSTLSKMDGDIGSQKARIEMLDTQVNNVSADFQRFTGFPQERRREALQFLSSYTNTSSDFEKLLEINKSVLGEAIDEHLVVAAKRRELETAKTKLGDLEKGLETAKKGKKPKPTTDAMEKKIGIQKTLIGEIEAQIAKLLL